MPKVNGVQPDQVHPDPPPERTLVAKQKGELIPVVVGFNYDLLDTKVAEQVRSRADRIRERVKKTVAGIIEVGNDLLAAKEALEHGRFGPWLKAEFGWSERTAQNFNVRGRAVQIRKNCGFAHSAERRLLPGGTL